MPIGIYDAGTERDHASVRAMIAGGNRTLGHRLHPRAVAHPQADLCAERRY